MSLAQISSASTCNVGSSYTSKVFSKQKKTPPPPRLRSLQNTVKFDGKTSEVANDSSMLDSHPITILTLCSFINAANFPLLDRLLILQQFKLSTFNNWDWIDQLDLKKSCLTDQ